MSEATDTPEVHEDNRPHLDEDHMVVNSEGVILTYYGVDYDEFNRQEIDEQENIRDRYLAQIKIFGVLPHVYENASEEAKTDIRTIYKTTVLAQQAAAVKKVEEDQITARKRIEEEQTTIRKRFEEDEITDREDTKEDGITAREKAHTRSHTRIAFIAGLTLSFMAAIAQDTINHETSIVHQVENALANNGPK